MYNRNDDYKKFLSRNQYDKIVIVKSLHTGYTEPLHFNGYFISNDKTKKSNEYHFYVLDSNIVKLTTIDILHLQ